MATHAGLLAGIVVIPAMGSAQLPEARHRLPMPVVEIARPPVPVQIARVRPQPAGQRRTSGPRVAGASRPAQAMIPTGPVTPIEQLTPGDDPPGCLVDCGGGTDPSGVSLPGIEGPGEPQETPLYRPGPHIREPKRVHYVPPEYPPLAARARLDGIVILECVLDEKGAVTDVKVLRGHELLAPAALDAVRQWRYTPTLLNGVPVRVVMTVTVNFVLER